MIVDGKVSIMTAQTLLLRRKKMMRDDLGNRMKGYESASKHALAAKVPVIARIDGKAFHSFTRGLDRPWDLGLQWSMWDAAKYAAERIQGCKIAYVQSDEISLLLTDYENENTQGWFNYKLEKMTSVAASMVTGGFIAAAANHLPERKDEFLDASGLPAFDARFFNLPKEEVNNYFYWRQSDAIRNSVQMLARSYFSHKDCMGKDNVALKAMLLEEKGISWEEQSHWCKYGACIIKESYEDLVTFIKNGEERTIEAKRSRWIRDLNVPIFYKNTEYIENLL
jgi:tRNA(His) 5'-end guanylyltransferase